MRRRLLLALAAGAVPVLIAGLFYFEPWRLFTSSTLQEPPPVAATARPSARPADSPTTPAPPVPKTVVLARGEFVSQEHDTSGTARVLQLADGSRVVRLEGLASSDGPDLHVWLSDATAGGDWHKYDDGRYVPLGDLKATHGSHNYPIPENAELEGLRSVVIWCDRFNVAFGSAPVSFTGS